MAVVKITMNARKQLKEIESFIAQDSLYYSQQVVLRIVHRIRQLALFPEIGAVVHELVRKSYREISAYSYRIIYTFDAESDTIFVNGYRRRYEQ